MIIHAARLGAFAAVCWLLAADAATAQAQGSQARYAELVTQAVREFNQGAWSEARILFERAHAISPSARTFRGLGLTAFELRRYVEAIAEFEAALGDRQKPLPEDQQREVVTALARARNYVGTGPRRARARRRHAADRRARGGRARAAAQRRRVSAERAGRGP